MSTAVMEANGILQILTGKGLGMTSSNFTLTASQTFAVPNAIQTVCPVKVRINIKLASGGLTLKASNNASGTYGSDDYTLAISDTAEHTLTFNTTATDLFANLKLVDSGAGSVVSSLEVLVYGLTTVGHDNPVTLKAGFDCLTNNASGGGTFTTDANS